MYKRTIVIVLCIVVLSGSPIMGNANKAAGEQLAPSGRLAYVGIDYNVYIHDLSTSFDETITSDATQQRRYEWPTWSRTGDLAYFCCNPRFATAPVLEAYVWRPTEASADLIYNSDNELLTYAYWSPVACGGGPCGGLAILATQLGQDTFRVRIINGPDSSLDLGPGAPFYYSWSPDGTQIITHRNNRLLDIYSLESGVYTSTSLTPGLMQAPAWSPIDDRVLVGVLDEEQRATDLVLVAGNQSITLVEDLPGLISYNWSPDGNYIAYRSVSGTGFSILTVLDAVTSERVAFTTSDGVVAFFWSPDSRKLAYVSLSNDADGLSARKPAFTPMTLLQQQNLMWSVLDIASGISRPYTTFIPTSEMLYLFNYFDQFSQSHRIWSPNSDYIAFSERTLDGQSVISALDMTRPDAVPFWVADGYIGIWSYE